MKKQLMIYGLSAIIALTIVSPLATQKVEAHTSDGKPTSTFVLKVLNMPIVLKHLGHISIGDNYNYER